MPTGRRLSPLVLMLLVLAGCPRKTTPEPIYLGHLAPLSGPHKALGEQARQSILLAVEEANKAEGQVAGRNVIVLHVDTRGDAETAQHEAVRLIKVNGVAGLLGGTDAVVADRLAKVAAQFSVPLVTPCGAVTPPSGDSVVSLGLSPARQGEILARFTAQDLKAQRAVLLVDSRDAISTALAAAYAREFPHDSSHRLEEWSFKTSADLTDLPARMKKAASQVFLYAGAAAEFVKVRAALWNVDPQVALLFGGSETARADLLADREGNRGLYLATTYVADTGTPAGQEFAKKYQERFHEPPDAEAALAYDGARLLLEALRRAKAVAGRVREELWREESFESLTGPLTLQKDRPARRTAFVVRLEGGLPKRVQRYEPESK